MYILHIFLDFFADKLIIFFKHRCVTHFYSGLFIHRKVYIAPLTYLTDAVVALFALGLYTSWFLLPADVR